MSSPRPGLTSRDSPRTAVPLTSSFIFHFTSGIWRFYCLSFKLGSGFLSYCSFLWQHFHAILIGGVPVYFSWVVTCWTFSFVLYMELLPLFSAHLSSSPVVPAKVRVRPCQPSPVDRLPPLVYLTESGFFTLFLSSDSSFQFNFKECAQIYFLLMLKHILCTVWFNLFLFLTIIVLRPPEFEKNNAFTQSIVLNGRAQLSSWCYLSFPTPTLFLDLGQLSSSLLTSAIPSPNTSRGALIFSLRKKNQKPETFCLPSSFSSLQTHLSYCPPYLFASSSLLSST